MLTQNFFSENIIYNKKFYYYIFNNHNNLNININAGKRI